MADEQVVEQPKFNAIEHIQQANEAEAARRNGKPVVPPVKQPEPIKEAKTAEPPEDGGNRRERRTVNRLREEVGEWRGRAESLQQILDRIGTKPEASPPTGSDDPEPQRSQYGSDAEHQRALGRWDARQEAAKVLSKVQETAAQKDQREKWEARLRDMDAKASEDIKKFDDWEEVAKSAAESEDAIEWTVEDHPVLMGLIASSKQKAGMLYHLAKNPDELKALLKLTSDQNEQIEYFRQLEGEVKVLYSKREPNKEVVQASEPKNSKERTSHPAEGATPGRNSAERDASKPRPSTEVAARGGSAPPSDLRIGSPEWHQRENERERANRGR